MVVFTGKTIAEAIENGLVTLKITRNEANIDVISTSKKGLFGRVRKEAEVNVEAKKAKFHSILDQQNQENIIKIEETNETQMTEEKVREMLINSLSRATAEYVKELSAAQDIIVKYEVSHTDDEILINLITGNGSKLIGKRGMIINELQEKANRYVYDAKLDEINVIIDTNGYRAKRTEILHKVAQRAIDEVIESEDQVFFDAMPEIERKQIHEFVQGNGQVRSYSEGKGSKRAVVIAPRTKLND